MKTTLFAGLLILLTLFSLSGCKTARRDYTIQYPAALLAEHPKEYWGSYVKVVGVLKRYRPQDQFPPYSAKDPVVCDSSGCIYVHDDTEDLSKYIGKKVKIIGYVEVTKFNFPYIDVLKIEEKK